MTTFVPRAVSREPITWRWENLVKGRKFRRKAGEVVYVAESLSIDDSYEAHYGFLNVFVKLRDPRNGRTVSVQDSQLRYDWVEVEE